MYYQNNADLITQIINQYTEFFASYFNQFLNWGKWLFYSFGVIAIVWLCLWRAFDKHAVSDAMPGFLKEFFLIAFFYTVMVNAAPWLSSVVDTAQSMGEQLTHQQVDPASLIQQGLTIANQILSSFKNSGVVNMSVGTTLIIIAYLVTLASFIAVALNLAITLLMTTFFISLSGIFLAFGTFSFTRNIARRTLDTVIAYSFKLLSLYIVINAGAGIFNQLASYLPSDKVTSFDIYGWSIAAALLFWAAAYYLPKQVLHLFSNAIQENNADDPIYYPPLPVYPAQITPIFEPKLFSDTHYPTSSLHIPKNPSLPLSKPRGSHGFI